MVTQSAHRDGSPYLLSDGVLFDTSDASVSVLFSMAKGNYSVTILVLWAFSRLSPSCLGDRIKAARVSSMGHDCSKAIMDKTTRKSFQQAHTFHRLTAAFGIDLEASQDTGRKDVQSVAFRTMDGATRSGWLDWWRGSPRWPS